MSKIVQISEYGKRCGESHGRAKLTDHECELIRQLKEGGMPAGEIAEKFEIHKRHVYFIAAHQKRACVVTKVKKI